MNQRADILDRGQARCDSNDDILLPAGKTERAIVRRAVDVRRFPFKGDAVVQRKNLLRVKAALNKHTREAVGHRHPVVKHAKRHGVKRAEGELFDLTVHIVQAVVRVDSRDDRDTAKRLHHDAHRIRLRPMAVQHIRLKCIDLAQQHAHIGQRHFIVNDGGIDPRCRRVLRKLPLAEAYQADIVCFCHARHQGQDVRFGAADISAANQVHDFHRSAPQTLFAIEGNLCIIEL